MANDNTSITDAARLFASNLPPAKHPDSQEALRFARWFGEDRPAIEIKPSDLEAYVETFGATAPTLAATRADGLKGFLAFLHKEKILPERYVSHVRVRRTASRTRAQTSPLDNNQDVRMTAEGHAAIVAELEGLVAQRPRIAQELREARADGDVRENAPLDAAREAQGQLEARVRELEWTLSHAVIVENHDEDDDGTGSAHVGCNVVLANITTGSSATYQLVNAAEARAGSGRLSVESPVGKAVVGRRVGDEVQVTAPSGAIRFRIEKIETN